MSNLATYIILTRISFFEINNTIVCYHLAINHGL
ncbi:MAG: hypothetical protein RLZZ546_1933 [Bacteroidota bacterium]|jgi:hypothetical protein